MKLDQYLARWHKNRMSYAGHDCARFAGGWAGLDLPPWRTKAQALRVVREYYGVDRVADAFAKAIGEDEEIDIYLARQGDIVSISTPPLDCLGICLGAESVFLGDVGLTRVKTRDCFRAWRVNK